MPKFSKLPPGPLFIHPAKPAAHRYVIVPLDLYLRGSTLYPTRDYWVFVQEDGIARVESVEATFFKFRVEGGQDIEGARADPGDYAQRINDRVAALTTPRPLSFRRGDITAFEDVLRSVGIALRCSRVEAVTNPTGLLLAGSRAEARQNPNGPGLPCMVLLYSLDATRHKPDGLLPGDCRKAVSMMLSEWFGPEGWDIPAHNRSRCPFPIRVRVDIAPEQLTEATIAEAKHRLRLWVDSARADVDGPVVDAFIAVILG